MTIEVGVDLLDDARGVQFQVGDPPETLTGFLIDQSHTGGWYGSQSTSQYSEHPSPPLREGDPMLQSLPAAGFDGYVNIPLGRYFHILNSTFIEIQRSSFAFHELLEVFLRTERGMFYQAAHDQAISNEGTLFNNSAPGQLGVCVHPDRIPNPNNTEIAEPTGGDGGAGGDGADGVTSGGR